jgi:hypothetical protein
MTNKLDSCFAHRGHVFEYDIELVWLVNCEAELLVTCSLTL